MTELNSNLLPEDRAALGGLDLSTIPASRRVNVLVSARAEYAKRQRSNVASNGSTVTHDPAFAHPVERTDATQPRIPAGLKFKPVPANATPSERHAIALKRATAGKLLREWQGARAVAADKSLPIMLGFAARDRVKTLEAQLRETGIVGVDGLDQ